MWSLLQNFWKVWNVTLRSETLISEKLIKWTKFHWFHSFYVTVNSVFTGTIVIRILIMISLLVGLIYNYDDEHQNNHSQWRRMVDIIINLDAGCALVGRCPSNPPFLLINTQRRSRWWRSIIVGSFKQNWLLVWAKIFWILQDVCDRTSGCRSEKPILTRALLSWQNSMFVIGAVKRSRRNFVVDSDVVEWCSSNWRIFNVDLEKYCISDGSKSRWKQVTSGYREVTK